MRETSNQKHHKLSSPCSAAPPCPPRRPTVGTAGWRESRGAHRGLLRHGHRAAPASPELGRRGQTQGAGPAPAHCPVHGGLSGRETLAYGTSPGPSFVLQPSQQSTTGQKQSREAAARTARLLSSCPQNHVHATSSTKFSVSDGKPQGQLGGPDCWDDRAARACAPRSGPATRHPHGRAGVGQPYLRSASRSMWFRST